MPDSAVNPAVQEVGSARKALEDERLDVVVAPEGSPPKRSAREEVHRPPKGQKEEYLVEDVRNLVGEALGEQPRLSDAEWRELAHVLSVGWKPVEQTEIDSGIVGAHLMDRAIKEGSPYLITQKASDGKFPPAPKYEQVEGAVRVERGATTIEGQRFRWYLPMQPGVFFEYDEARRKVKHEKDRLSDILTAYLDSLRRKGATR